MANSCQMQSEHGGTSRHGGIASGCFPHGGTSRRGTRASIGHGHDGAWPSIAKRLACFFVFVLCDLFAGTPAHAAQSFSLSNEHLTATFDQRGLVSIYDTALDARVPFVNDSFAVTVNSQALSSARLAPPSATQLADRIEYTYRAGHHGVKAVYELKPGWRFVTKHLLVASRDASFVVGTVAVFCAGLRTAPDNVLPLHGGSYGSCLRFMSSAPPFGMFLLVQNPFMQGGCMSNRLAAAYAADMSWQSSNGVFMSDRCCIGTYPFSGTEFPATMVPEWKYSPLPETNQVMMDIEETEALIACVRSFLLYHPTNSVRIHVGWCGNDYQIDAATSEGRTEYKRIIERAAAMGCKHLLYGASHSTLGPMSENRDAWGWERVLWLNLGQKIRKGEWLPSRDTIPPTVQELLDYAKTKRVKLVAYAYPSLVFKEHPEWSAWAEHPGCYCGADTGLRSFQDWWLDTLVSFYKLTGIGGYSFDHWWIGYDKASSHYAQWYGCRRILNTLRARLPDCLIDGRQQYQGFGPWTWVAGTYPHPTSTDEQPGSFKAFPDLHTDRVAGDRQRFVAWLYRMTRFTPTEILPGFITHQTQRSDEHGTMHNDRFRPRDWDALGWKYSLLSSIASAPMNHVVNMIPARDTEEFNAFTPEQVNWFRYWLDWTDRNFECLRHVRQIIGQPMVGRTDGTAAIMGDHGFVFLFNPNYRAMSAIFSLDHSIRLTGGTAFVITELYPVAGRRIGKPGTAFWHYGDSVSIPMEGAQAAVLELEPAPTVATPLLFNVPGSVMLKDSQMRIVGASGEVGTTQCIMATVPPGTTVSALSVNGASMPFTQSNDVILCKVEFPGTRFCQCQQAGTCDPQFSGQAYRAEFTVPARIFKQLNARRTRWPVPYTEDDLRAPWLGSYRLLLFINIADPREDMAVSLTLDGTPVQVKKAYNSIYPGGNQTFMGFYADVSDIQADKQHTAAVSLPSLAPGQFQGLFFDNVETEHASQVTRPPRQ